ncbi:MAG: secretin N-terminal domain-containing protein [Planctomycetota bacterium]|jgi:general secretion pathway protein D
MTTSTDNRLALLLAAVLATAVCTTQAPAQDGRPAPAAPEKRANGNGNGNGNDDGDVVPTPPDEPAEELEEVIDDSPIITPRTPIKDPLSPDKWNMRRDLPGDPVKLGFREEPIGDNIFAFMAEATGKVVMPVNLVAIKNKKITLINDEWIERSEALDMLIQAFRHNGVGVIEKDDVIIIGNIEEIILSRQLPVLNADVDVMYRKDKGSLAIKLFRVKNVKADEIGELLRENMPSYADLKVDPNSNQIVVMGDIALFQHLQPLIEELDHSYIEPETRTFRLAYADATDVSENITELFDAQASGSSRSSSSSSGSTPRRSSSGRGSSRQTSTPGTSVVGPEIELRVTVHTQQNSVTCTGEPTVLDEIARLIDEEWDLPRSPGTSRIYTLQYTDPLKVAEKLNALLGQGTGGAGGGARGRSGGSGGGSVDQILQGIYRIEPYPDTSQLLVFCKTQESLEFLDQVIADLDQPSGIGLPFVTELKHANAIELAEELNALLSEPGTGATIERPGEGISGRDEEGGAAAADAGSAGTISFPWQRGGRQRDDQSPESSLIGKVRIVPIVRQNALAVLCPSPQRDAVRELIEYFDRPGRQVMIKALICEVELKDELSLGLRFSTSDDIITGNPDYQIGGTIGLMGQSIDTLGRLFDTSTVDTNISLNIVLQALNQLTNVRILQEPTLFTGDNQEALFFDGQDIPFITNTVINTQGNPNNSFEYREVGVVLNVRPRITVERDVDLEILLELSSIVPGVTLFGGPIVDRRETRTHVVVKDGQTIVLAGIMREEESKITRKVPLLGDIPIVGELFKSRENATTKTELVAFVTPYVVDNPTENNTATFQEEYRGRLEDLTRPVEEQAREDKANPEARRDRFLPPMIRQNTAGEDAPSPPTNGDR